MEALEANQRIGEAGEPINEDQGERAQNDDVDVNEIVDGEVPAIVRDETHGGITENEVPNEQVSDLVATSHDYFYRSRSGNPTASH